MRPTTTHRSGLRWLTAAGFGVLIGCSDPSTGSDDDPTTSASTGTTASTPDPGSTGIPTTNDPAADSTTDTTADASGFIDHPDGSPFNFECDLFEQDCPKGEKCMAAAMNGGTWDSTICVPIAEDPGAPGDPCTVEVSAQSGFDDCELGAVCAQVNNATLEGICAAMCIGDPSAPTCADPNSTCIITASGAGPLLCQFNCDPVAQNCPEGQGCYAVSDDFLCQLDASGRQGAAGDSCEFTNVCDPGNLCLNPDATPGCASGVGCCSSVCSLADPMPPCLPGQSCVPWYERGGAPPNYEDVGVCFVE